MEIRHLKYFLAVAEELNFSKAAEKLFISQPPLSRQIKELEEELQARLFDRNNKRVVLTEAGQFFRAEAQELLNHLERATLHTRKIAAHLSGVFRIAYISSAFSSNITELIKHLVKLYPYATFRLYELTTPKQVLALEQGKLDLGILRAPIFSTKIKTNLWFREGYALVYNKKLFHIERESDLRLLKNETFVFFNKEYAPQFYDSLVQICAFYGFRPNVVHESNNVSSIIELVRNGLGVSILPASLSRHYSDNEMQFLNLHETGLESEVVFATPVRYYSEIVDVAMNFLCKTN